MSATRQTHASFASVGAYLWRAAVLLSVWLIVSGVANLSDLLMGAAAAAIAAHVSINLLPPGKRRMNAIGFVMIALRLPLQSILAGIDVVRRALDPRLPLYPGVIPYTTRLPRGPARSAFAALTGMFPGTVPVPGAGDTFAVHCIDVRQPIISQLGAEEESFEKALGMEGGHG